MSKLLANCAGFQWDQGNSGKNWILHGVSNSECEEVFFNRPLIVKDDKKHSRTEKRYYALGRTDSDRLLFIAFTIRNNLIRAISARNMNDKELEKYYEKAQSSPKI